jgi:hypothetical protein
MEISSQASEIPPVVRALVEETREEFEDLIARRKQLSWQISKISNALRALSSVLDLQLLPEPVHDEIFAEPSALNERDKDDNALLKSSRKNNQPLVSRTQLKRACRIALMETEGPASLREIAERIIRRGSCDLGGCKNPAAILNSALTSLALEGEAQLIRKGNCSYWQRLLQSGPTVSGESGRRSRRNMSARRSPPPREHVEHEYSYYSQWI